MNELEQWALHNEVEEMVVTTKNFIWTIGFTPELEIRRARAITRGYVTPRKHDLTIGEARAAWADPEYAKTLHGQFQAIHTERWTQYYKEWKSKKTPEERAEQDEKRRAYQRVYQRELRRKQRAEQMLADAEFNKRGN